MNYILFLILLNIMHLKIIHFVMMLIQFGNNVIFAIIPMKSCRLVACDCSQECILPFIPCNMLSVKIHTNAEPGIGASYNYKFNIHTYMYILFTRINIPSYDLITVHFYIFQMHIKLNHYSFMVCTYTIKSCVKHI